MSDLDLTVAVDAAESALGDPDYIGCSCCAQFPEGDEDRHHAIAHQAVTAAAPLIAAQVRAQVAAEIVDYMDAVLDLVDTQNGARLAFEEIARIARGES